MLIENLQSIFLNDNKNIYNLNYEKIASELFNLDISSNLYPCSLDSWLYNIQKYHTYLLYNDSSNLIVGVCVWLDNSIIQEMELIQIIISKNYMGKGIASKWLTYMCEIYKNFILRLEVRKSNLVAQQLYKKCKFSIIGERKNYYPIYDNKSSSISSKENAILMEKLSIF